MQLLLGKMEEQLKLLPDNSVDSIVTDPPYGITFMGKGWDRGVPGKEMWEEAIRVLKPGGHLISFSSARTYHRSTVAIEDAGFEIRDQVMWVYGSGFPKSHNLGKAYDKKHGVEREVVGTTNQPSASGHHAGNTGRGVESNERHILPVTAGSGPLEGWGTALKPAHEPITVARKPISEKTVLANAERWGVGGLNIDATRVGYSEHNPMPAMNGGSQSFPMSYGKDDDNGSTPGNPEGRWPANFIHDGSQGVLDLFPDAKGGNWTNTDGARPFNNDGKKTNAVQLKSDSSVGSAARFFYVPKVSKKDRNEGLDGVVEETRKPAGDFRPSYDQDGTTGTAYGRWGTGLNTHPTVKPTDLMHYLIRMVTPAGGVVLDPFMGSGSTGKAAIRNGYDFIGIEMEQESYDVAKARIEWEQE